MKYFNKHKKIISKIIVSFNVVLLFMTLCIIDTKANYDIITFNRAKDNLKRFILSDITDYSTWFDYVTELGQSKLALKDKYRAGADNFLKDLYIDTNNSDNSDAVLIWHSKRISTGKEYYVFMFSRVNDINQHKVFPVFQYYDNHTITYPSTYLLRSVPNINTLNTNNAVKIYTQTYNITDEIWTENAFEQIASGYTSNSSAYEFINLVYCSKRALYWETNSTPVFAETSNVDLKHFFNPTDIDIIGNPLWDEILNIEPLNVPLLIAPIVNAKITYPVDETDSTIIAKLHDQSKVVIPVQFRIYDHELTFNYPNNYLEVDPYDLFEYTGFNGIEIKYYEVAFYNDVIVGKCWIYADVTKGQVTNCSLKLIPLEPHPDEQDLYDILLNQDYIIHSVNGFIDENLDGMDDRTGLTQNEIQNIRDGEEFEFPDKDIVQDITTDKFTSFSDVIENVKDFYMKLYNVIPAYLHGILASAFVLLFSVGLIKVALG